MTFCEYIIMKPNRNERSSIRLKRFDYSSPGCYFITICSKNRECFFGEVRNEEIFLNDIGRIVEDEIKKTKNTRSNISIDFFTIMPNHAHLIMRICAAEHVAFRDTSQECPSPFGSGLTVRATQRVAPTLKSNSTGSVIGQIKSACSKRAGFSLWQRNYYEHIIRDEESYAKILEYIESNPKTWLWDENNPDNRAPRP